MHAINGDGVEDRLGGLSIPVDPNNSIGRLFQWAIDHSVPEIMQPVANRLVNLINSAVLKLECKMAIRLRIPRQHQHPRRILVKTMAYLRLGMVFPRHVKEVDRIRTIVKGRQSGRLIDNHVIVVLPEKNVAESDSVFQLSC